MSAVNTYHPTPKQALLRVNGIEIPEELISAEMAQYDDAKEAAWQQAATALVVKELLLQQAKTEEVSGKDDQELIEALLERNIQVPIADEAECERYFLANRGKFRAPDIIEARHILLMAPMGDQEARDQAQFEAGRLIEDLGQDPRRFAEQASLYSACPSKETGGQLGQLSPGSTVPEFESRVFRLNEGLAQQPIETRYGYHVVFIDRKIEGQALPYELVRDSIARYLEDNVFRRALSQYIQLLAGSAHIEGLELKAASSPLVQ